MRRVRHRPAALAAARSGSASDRVPRRRPGAGAPAASLPLAVSLRRRLQALIVVSLLLLAMLNAVFEYRATGSLASVLAQVLLPHLLIVVMAAGLVHWSVERALRPLRALAEAVGRRSAQDLSAIDLGASPQEVRPLVSALNRLFELVQAQAEGQRRFVADAAHQLRTPLAALQSQVEAWAQSAQRAGAGGSLQLPAEQIERLLGAARRTTQLANQLLALSRADARTSGVLPMERIDLKALCESMLEDVLETALRRGIDLGLEAQPVAVPGQGWLLRELLANLVDNAIKYTPPGGTVTLRCGLRPGGARLEVEDDGPGVPPQALPRLFDRFYRVPGSPGEGTGLGLAIAQEIARAHRSTLRAGPGAQGRGLRMTLDLRALPGFRGAG